MHTNAHAIIAPGNRAAASHLPSRAFRRGLFKRATAILIFVALIVASAEFGGRLRAESTTETVSSAAEQAKQSVESTGQAALTKIEQLWQKIDAERLRNRTPHEIVAWVIMGLLVGGLLAQVVGINRWAALFFGLVGSFIGGIIAHVLQIDLGIGPVLIRYEDLLFAFAGGVILLILSRMFMKRKKPKS